MWKTSGYFISVLIILPLYGLSAQDTIQFPLKIRAGADISGPVIYFNDKSIMNIEGFISFDRNEKMALVIEGGYLDYQYSQYNYDYTCNGIFARAGVDFNLLRPELAAGKYYAGLGLRYGISLFKPETPSFTSENYWGSVLSSVPGKTSIGHFLEVSPGVRAELFRNFSMGWTIRLRMLVSGGGGKDLRPIHFPGYGNGDKTVNAGFNYYLSWSIPFRTKTVISKVEPPEEPEETDESINSQQFNSR